MKLSIKIYIYCIVNRNKVIIMLYVIMVMEIEKIKYK